MSGLWVFDRHRAIKVPWIRQLWNPTLAHRTRKDGAPGKSLGLQGAEAAAEAAEVEWLARLIPYLDYGAFGYDIAKEVWEYNEFKKKLKAAQEHECSCEQ